MTDTPQILRIILEGPAVASVAFENMVDELGRSLGDLGLGVSLGPEGRITQDDRVLGRVLEWLPGQGIRLAWHPADWAPESEVLVDIVIEPLDAGSRITCVFRGLATLIPDAGEFSSWGIGQVLVRSLTRLTPEHLGDWLTDRSARRPSGSLAKKVYAEPMYHYPNFHALLAELELGPDDVLLEVGCGGGAFLKMALASGCQAAAIDHSPDMVEVARRVNRQALAEGRLDVRLGEADAVPFADNTFTRAAMTGVLGFLPDPVHAMTEIRRTLASGGLFVCFGSDPATRGTLASPEPIASRLSFYTDPELRQLGLKAGFERAEVVRRDLLPFARQVGIPEKHLPLFSDKAPFLIARKA